MAYETSLNFANHLSTHFVFISIKFSNSVQFVKFHGGCEKNQDC